MRRPSTASSRRRASSGCAPSRAQGRLDESRHRRRCRRHDERGRSRRPRRRRAGRSERFGLPTFVDNDVNALALAEWTFGAGHGVRSLVVLALGTGLGAGIVLDGRLVRGAEGFGGELGHSPVKFDGRPCWCGGRGCLAVYASGRGIAEAARARVAGRAGEALLTAAGGDPARITAPLVFRAAAHGDPTATGIVEEACLALGAMIG